MIAIHLQCRRLLYSLCTLLFVAILAWLACRLSTIHARRVAIAALEARGVASVSYDFRDPRDGGATCVPIAWDWPGKAWLRAWLGRDWTNAPVEIILTGSVKEDESDRETGSEYRDEEMMHVGRLRTVKWLILQSTSVTDDGLLHLKDLPLEGLELGGAPITDHGLEVIGCLKSLRDLDLTNTKITDAGLWQLTKLPALQDLGLADTAITDEGLKVLEGLSSLDSLFLDYTDITDAGLESLKGMHQLEFLGISNTRVNGTGLKYLAGLDSLRTLYLYRTKLTDAGLKELGKLTSLQILMLGSAQINDAGLAYLTKLTALKHLNLNFTSVTDAGLAYLADMHELEYVELYETQVTAAGFARLEAQLGRHIEGFVAPTDGKGDITDFGRMGKTLE